MYFYNSSSAEDLTTHLWLSTFDHRRIQVIRDPGDPQPNFLPKARLFVSSEQVAKDLIQFGPESFQEWRLYSLGNISGQRWQWVVYGLSRHQWKHLRKQTWGTMLQNNRRAFAGGCLFSCSHKHQFLFAVTVTNSSNNRSCLPSQGTPSRARCQPGVGLRSVFAYILASVWIEVSAVPGNNMGH